MAVDPGDRAASRDVRKTPVGLPIAWIQSRTGTLLGQLLSPATGPNDGGAPAAPEERK